MEMAIGIAGVVAGIVGVVAQAVILKDMLDIRKHLKGKSRKEMKQYEQWEGQVEKEHTEKFSSPEDEEMVKKFIEEYLEWSTQQKSYGSCKRQ